MQIQGNALFSVLGSLQQPSAAGQAPPAKNTQAGAADSRRPAAETQARPAAATGPAHKTAAAPGPTRAQSLEQAVQTLNEQGRLPPRGSLVDLRA